MRPKFLFNSPDLKNQRQSLRNNSTGYERILWSELKKSKLGVKFRRQHSIGGYVLDFYCPAKKLAIELDGYPHRARKEQDNYRTRTLKTLGIRTIRFWNGDLKTDLDEVLRKISTTLFDSPS